MTRDSIRPAACSALPAPPSSDQGSTFSLTDCYPRTLPRASRISCARVASSVRSGRAVRAARSPPEGGADGNRAVERDPHRPQQQEHGPHRPAHPPGAGNPVRGRRVEHHPESSGAAVKGVEDVVRTRTPANRSETMLPPGRLPGSGHPRGPPESGTCRSAGLVGNGIVPSLSTDQRVRDHAVREDPWTLAVCPAPACTRALSVAEGREGGALQRPVREGLHRAPSSPSHRGSRTKTP